MIIHCIGILRSGSTLQYNLVKSLVEKTGFGRGEGNFTAEDFINPETYAHWESDDFYHVIKMHNLHPRATELIQAGKMKTCSIFRDIRDVAVSLKLKQDFQGEELFHLLGNAIQGYYRIEEIPDVYVQRYEYVTRDLASAAYELSRYLGIPATPELITGIADECQINRAKTITTALREKIGDRIAHLPLRRADSIMQHYKDDDTLLHPNHISKYNGMSGTWRKELSEQEIAAIMQQHLAWFDATGYCSFGDIHWAQQPELRSFFTQPHGTFIEVGAGDGLGKSNTLHLENTGWQGVLIEEDMDHCTRMALNRPRSVCLNYACRSTNMRHSHYTRPLHDIIEEFHMDKIDFLALSDRADPTSIIEGLIPHRYRPRYIFAAAPGNGNLRPFLATLGYEMIDTVIDQNPTVGQMYFHRNS